MSNPQIYATMAVVAALLCSPASLHAQRVDAYLSEDSVSVGDRFTLILTAIHGFDEAPSFPSMDSAFGDITPLELMGAGTKSIDPEIRLDSAIYAVTTFALDTARLAPLVIGFDNFSVTATTPEREVYVTSLVPPNTTEIRDMTGPVEFARPLWPYVLLGIALLIAAGLIWYLIWRRRSVNPPSEDEPVPVDIPPPASVALSRLDALENAPLTNRSQVEFFYVELSDTLRTYVEHRLQIPALESTTFELIQDLAHPTIQYQIPAGIPTQLEQILSLADLVKFADLTPEVHQGRSALDEARQVIQRVETKFDQRAASEHLGVKR